MYKDLFKRYTLLTAIIALLSFVLISCSDDNTNEPTKTDEVLELVKYLEGADVKPSPIINNMPLIISPTDVNTAVLTNDATMAIIDIRATADYEKGHIKGAVNVPATDIINYYETNNLSAKANVVIACYTGQEAGWAACLLRMLGYDNVKSLKWGMSSWHSDFDKWSSMIANSGKAQFETTVHDKPAAGKLPELNTGKTIGSEIAKERVKAVLAEKFDAIKIPIATVLANPGNYFIANFWPLAYYTDPGHIIGAYNYQPKTQTAGADFLFDSFLKTLPTNKTIVVYCYTGQTSAYVAAYLRVLGYDAKSLLFGANGMIYDDLKAKGLTNWDKTKECKEYDYVK